jgi:hypothetical protein
MIIICLSLKHAGARDIAGKVAKPAAEKVISFLAGMLGGDVKGATKILTKDDYLDV